MDLLFISFVSEVTYEVLSKTCQVCIKQITYGSDTNEVKSK